MSQHAKDASRIQAPITERQLRRLIGGLLLGAAALSLSRPVAAAPRLVVAVYPDQGSSATGSDVTAGRGFCACDGHFDAADARLGQAMPLAALTVRLLDAEGREMARAATAAQPNGRQVAVLGLPGKPDWRAELLDLPSGWQRCTGAPDTAAPDTAAPAADRGDHRLEIGLRPTCVEAQAQGSAGYNSGISAQAADQPRSAGAFHRQVTGHVFVDRDLDGLSDADEVGLAGVRVTLAEGRRTHRTRTALSGRFAFRGAIAAGYVVEVQVPSGYRVTTTDRFQHVPQSAVLGTTIGFGLMAVERGSASAPAPKAASLSVSPAARVLASPPRQQDGVRFVAAWPPPAGAATSLFSIGMTEPGPQVGAGRHPTSSIGKDDPTCAS